MSASTPAKARIELVLDPGSDPITGEIHGGDGIRTSFRGWLELIRALERVHAPDGPAATETERRGER